MKAKIQRNQIHLFKEDILDAEGNPTGEELDILWCKNRQYIGAKNGLGITNWT